jgi:uncharacterized damage-inducible protein DinB
MDTLGDYSKMQYGFVKNSRAVLFDYCKTITAEDFTNQNTSFGRGGSMRNLLVHIANTYQYWVANLALKMNVPYPEYDDCKDIDDVIRLFDSVDDFMERFISEMDETEISFEINNEISSATPFKLFSHVITHEFHHKGQILSISRHLGYTPVDTDIMR